MPVSRESSTASSTTGAQGMRTSLRLGHGTQVCADAELKGEIVLGARCFVHPKARIIAEAGPIVIGEGNIIEEQALIINEIDPSDRQSSDVPRERPVMSIGAQNMFEIGCTVKCKRIGDNNVFEPKSFVGKHVEVSHGCTIGALCHVNSRDRLPDNCVIYGQDRLCRIAAEKPQTPALQFDHLSNVAPKFHNMKKVKTIPKQH